MSSEREKLMALLMSVETVLRLDREIQESYTFLVKLDKYVQTPAVNVSRTMTHEDINALVLQKRKAKAALADLWKSYSEGS